MTFASWAAGPVSLGVAMVVGLRNRIRGPFTIGMVAATIFWAADAVPNGLRPLPALGWSLWVLALWRLDSRDRPGALAGMRPGAVALWLSGVWLGLSLLPWTDLNPVSRVLVLFLVVLPAVMVPGMLAASHAARVLLRQVANHPRRAVPALATALALGLALSALGAAALVVVLATMPHWAGGVLVAPGPALIAARINPAGHLWLLAIVMLPMLPVLIAATTGGIALAIALRQRGRPRALAGLAAVTPATFAACLAAVAGIAGAPVLLGLLEPLAR